LTSPVQQTATGAHDGRFSRADGVHERIDGEAMTTLAIGLLLGGFVGWFLHAFARREKLWMHRWNRTRQFTNARREIARGIDC